MRVTGALFFTIAFTLLSSAAEPRWVGTWEASPAPQLADESQMRADKLEFQNQTLREIVHISIGGGTVRVRLSNAYGKDTVEIGAAHVALHSQGAGIVAGSDRVLTFGGQPGISIPPDAPAVSDPVKLDVPALGDVVVSIFLPKTTAGAGIHYSAQQTSYIAAGDVTGANSIPGPITITSWVFLTGVDVLAPEPASAIVAFGDSITDGARSTVDANHRWPNLLANRLLARGSKEELAVLDAGIGGNRILHDAATNIQFGVNALARFNRDVIAQSGVKYVIVLEGINDLGHAGTSAPKSQEVSAEEVIQGLKQMIARSHEESLKIFGGTLTPFEGTVYPGYFTPEKEVKRKAINEWIRTSHAFDGVIDFDQAVHDPNHPDRMLPAYDGGDHLHPSDAGYRAMADAVPLSLFIPQKSGWQPAAGHTEAPIWRSGVPDAKPAAGPEIDTTTSKEALVAGTPVVRLGNVASPTITFYAPKDKNTGAAVVVFPGGGYRILAIDLEGTEVCDWLSSSGITCVLLKYRVPDSGPYPKSPAALEDAQRALGLVRFHAVEWHIDPHRIGVLGFSAGAHLAAALSTHFDQRLYKSVDAADQVSCRPDFAVIVYPGYLALPEQNFAPNPEIHVTRETPPTFLLQTEDDRVAHVESSLTYYAALKSANVPVEMHLYTEGVHGYGLRRTALPVTGWPQLVETWLHTIKMLPE